MTARVGRRVFPTLTQPLPSRDALRAEVAEDAAWEALFERPLGEAVEAAFDDDVEQGIALTDGLIGTFASAHEPSLRQNRCFLYHVIGNGEGHWDVPVGGHGRAHRRARPCGAGGRRRDPLRHRGDRDRPRGRGALGRRLRRGGARAGRDRAARARPPARRAGARAARRGRAAEAQHAALAAAPAARSGRRPARGVRRHLPRQRVGLAAAGRLRAGRRAASSRRCRRARPTATR